MKKLYLFSLLMAVCVSANLMADSQITMYGVSYSIDENNNATIIGTAEDFKTADFVVESQVPYNTWKIIAIGEAAFAGNNVLRSVDFSQATNLRSIGNRAFQNTALKSVELTQDNLVIGENAFENCASLTSLKLTGRNMRIGKQAFNFCTALERMVDFGDNALIGEQAFRYCNKLTLLVFDKVGITFESLAFQAIGDGMPIYIYLRNYLPMFNASAVFVDDTNKKLKANVFVPCDLIDMYNGSYDWPQVATPTEEVANYRNIEVPASVEGGYVDVAAPTCASYVFTLTALADDVNGYEFKGWKDGNTDNPRSIDVIAFGSSAEYNVDAITPVFEKTFTGLTTIDGSQNKVRKVIIDGQLRIVHNGKTYNALGAEVK